jgi:endonuclease/exonuclease/phosphatase family metal-dependent hydrolase
VWFAGPVLEIALPPRADSTATPSTLPRKPNGATRLVSWNVEWEGPAKNPPPFRRVLAALDADILSLQEWRIAENDLAKWFSTHLPSPQPWRAHTYPDLGVAVVSRLPLTPLTTDRLVPDRDVDGKSRSAIRFVAARVETPLGPLLTGSMHLKCCGGKDTYEDRLRIAQVETIRTFVRSVLAQEPDLRPVLSGDFNLVGSRQPLDLLASDLDSDGSALGVADALVAGGDAAFTWTDADSPFSPGRLDYTLFADADLEVAQSFVLDVARLSPASRAAAGLEGNDQLASDHRPLVIDLMRRAPKTAAPAPAPNSPRSRATGRTISPSSISGRPGASPA